MIETGVQNLSNIHPRLSLLGMHFLCLQKVVVVDITTLKMARKPVKLKNENPLQNPASKLSLLTLAHLAFQMLDVRVFM